ncbi:MAG: DsrE family protein [Deltaproteobacteria bacterium]|nr:DsrE family protein [Deltaproteobacteria bacterium]MDZ4344979.1 DsrE family protein [Candidatus Binatia bacterium]
MPKILNIVETAYRATLEEQDDTVLWLTHMLKNAGADISVLLRANAVNYAVKGQDASGLAFGEAKMTHPPEIDKDVEKMIQKGVPVYLVEQDVNDRGLSDADFVSGIKKVKREALPELIDQHDQVWHW